MTERILWIDVIRGISILAMITFHFAFDLMYFGFAKPDLIYQPDWRLFERMIAFSFLFIAGLSLFITHGSLINWKSFIRRYGITAICAVLISSVTYFLFNNDMIRFGILHAISISGLIGLLLLKLNSLSLFLLAVLIFFSGQEGIEETIDVETAEICAQKVSRSKTPSSRSTALARRCPRTQSR